MTKISKTHHITKDGVVKKNPEKLLQFPKDMPLNHSKDGIFRYLQLTFNLERANYLAGKLPVKNMKALDDMIAYGVNIDESFAMKSTNDKPVIFVEVFIPDRVGLLIDGNHRMYRAVKLNKNIDYVLIPNKYVPYILMNSRGDKSKDLIQR